MKKHEKQILEAYMNLPVRKLLKHRFELEEDYLAGYVSRFLKGKDLKKSLYLIQMMNWKLLFH